MRRFISILCLLIAFTFQSFAKEVKEVKSNTETVNAVFVGIENGIQALAESLKTPAENVWKILVKQQLVDSMSYTFIFSLFIFLSLFTMIKMHKKAKENNYEIFDDGSTALPYVIAIVTLLITIIAIMICFSSIITGFVNPEYGAIKDIIDTVKLE